MNCPECNGKIKWLGEGRAFCLDCDWDNLPTVVEPERRATRIGRSDALSPGVREALTRSGMYRRLYQDVRELVEIPTEILVEIPIEILWWLTPRLSTDYPIAYSIPIIRRRNSDENEEGRQGAVIRPLVWRGLIVNLVAGRDLPLTSYRLRPSGTDEIVRQIPTPDMRYQIFAIRADMALTDRDYAIINQSSLLTGGIVGFENGIIWLYVDLAEFPQVKNDPRIESIFEFARSSDSVVIWRVIDSDGQILSKRG